MATALPPLQTFTATADTAAHLTPVPKHAVSILAANLRGAFPPSAVVCVWCARMRVLAIALTAVLIVLSVVAIVGGFALLARRLLGMRFGVVRLLAAGLLAFAVVGPIARAVLGAVPTTEGAVTPAWFLVLTSASALVVAMVFLVIAEALVPTGSLPGPMAWRREFRGRLARTRRCSQISRIAIRNGLRPYLRGRRRAELDTPDARDELARSVRRALDEGGVTFVKLGQILSTRPDLLPPEFTDELSRLQDRAAPGAVAAGRAGAPRRPGRAGRGGVRLVRP
jgi:hypothetical protein